MGASFREMALSAPGGALGLKPKWPQTDWLQRSHVPAGGPGFR